jgi:hypothetical protein
MFKKMVELSSQVKRCNFKALLASDLLPDEVGTRKARNKINGTKDYGHKELDKLIAEGVEIRPLSPDETGFASWKRCKDYQISA